MDLLEQFDDGGGRELHACQAVEPKCSAGKAEFHPYDAMIVALEVPGLHVLSTVRAASGTGINAGHGMATVAWDRDLSPRRAADPLIDGGRRIVAQSIQELLGIGVR